MVRVLIVGESGEPPWEGGCAKKLCEWLEVASIQDLKERYLLANVYPIKDTKEFSAKHYAALLDMIDASDLVLLVGKEAQRRVYGYMRPMFWLRGKFAGVPHPSGRNRQLNDAGNERMVRSFVRNTIALFECAPDRPLDVPAEVKDAQVDSKHDSVQHDDVLMVHMGGVNPCHGLADQTRSATTAERGPRSDSEAGAQGRASPECKA